MLWYEGKPGWDRVLATSADTEEHQTYIVNQKTATILGKFILDTQTSSLPLKIPEDL